MLNLYITSPNRKDGKTILTSALASTMQSLGYKTSVYKPVQLNGIEKDGFMQSPDITYLKTIDPYINTGFTYLFKGNTEPLLAAELEGKTIDIDTITKDWQKYAFSTDCTIVDGEGGLMSPIAPGFRNLEMLKKVYVPVLFVTTPSENSINTTLLTINTAVEAKLPVRGVIVNNNDESKDSKALTSLIRIIEEYTDAKVIGLLPNLGLKPLPDELITGVLNGVDIESVFDIKIEKLEFSS